MRKRINLISKGVGIPTKKVLDFLFILRSGGPLENNELLQKIGVSKNSLNQAKELLSSLFKPPSKNTQLEKNATQEVQALFGPDYKTEEALWHVIEDEHYRKSIELLKKYTGERPSPERKYDQFTATIETTARRASLLNFFEDIRDKRLLFLGDDDFTSIAVANFHTASKVTVLDIDHRILDKINTISIKEKLNINTVNYDVRKVLPDLFIGKFDTVFTDPPYTIDGVRLFVSRVIQTLNHPNKAARIYLCYGNSDKAKERFLPIYEILASSGLMIRWVFDKFNRYQGAESIGSTSSLFISEVTSKTKPLVINNYEKSIYTNN